jgi:hypothetical protein
LSLASWVLSALQLSAGGAYHVSDNRDGLGLRAAVGYDVALGLGPELRLGVQHIGRTKEVLGVEITKSQRDYLVQAGLLFRPLQGALLRPYFATHLGLSLGSEGTTTGGHTRLTDPRPRATFSLVTGLLLHLAGPWQAGAEVSYWRLWDMEAAGNLGIGGVVAWSG